MRRLPTRNGGFSLLELILVLMIIGIILGAISLTLFDRRLDELKQQSRRLQAVIRLAVDEAVIRGQELGLLISEDGYEFLQLDDESWQAVDIEASRQFQMQAFEDQLEVLVQVSGLYGAQTIEPLLEGIQGSQSEPEQDGPESRELVVPQILMLSSSEVTPFVIRLGYDDDEPVYMEIKTSITGSIELTGPIFEPIRTGWSST